MGEEGGFQTFLGILHRPGAGANFLARGRERERLFLHVVGPKYCGHKFATGFVLVHIKLEHNGIRPDKMAREIGSSGRELLH